MKAPAIDLYHSTYSIKYLKRLLQLYKFLENFSMQYFVRVGVSRFCRGKNIHLLLTLFF